MSDDLAQQLRGIGMPVCNQAAAALEAKERQVERLHKALASVYGAATIHDARHIVVQILGDAILATAAPEGALAQQEHA